MDKVEEKLADLEVEFDTAWKHEVSMKQQLKQDLVNFIIVGAFYLLSWFFLFALFLIPSALGAFLLNLKFLVRALRHGSGIMILFRVIISAIVVPTYFWMVYSMISQYIIDWNSQ